MLKINKVKKVISLVVVTAVMVGVTRHIGVVRTNANEVKNQDGLYTEDELNPIGDFYDEVEEDGVIYDTYMYKSGRKNFTQFIDKSNDIRKDVVYDSERMMLEVIEYEIKDNNGEEVYKLTSSNKTDIGEKIKEFKGDNECITKSSYNRKVKDGYKSDLWYMKGKNDKGKAMRKIGRVAEYEISYYSISEDKQSKVDEYIKCVNTTNDLHEKISVRSHVAVPVLIALFIAGGWPAVIGAGFFIPDIKDLLIDLEATYNDAADLYNKIKAYGKKL